MRMLMAAVVTMSMILMNVFFRGHLLSMFFSLCPDIYFVDLKHFVVSVFIMGLAHKHKSHKEYFTTGIISNRKKNRKEKDPRLK